MKTIDLYKFIQEHNIEYHWNDDDVIMFVSIYNIEDFNKMLPNGIFDDAGVECIMKDRYFAFYMEFICNYCDIEMSDIFEQGR